MSLLTKTASSLQPNDIVQLLDIFNKLGWKLDENLEQTANHRIVFERFCEFLSFLNEHEKDLVLQLTRDFLHCRYWDYPILLRIALLEIPKDLINKSESIFLTRLISPKDKGKTKSSSGMTYMCHREVIPKLPEFVSKNIWSYDEPDLIDIKHKKRVNSLIILLDDFIGSGDTAIEAIDYFNKNVANKSDTIILVSIVAQIEGVLRIEERGHQVFYAKIRERAISDSTKIINKLTALKLIRGIEKRMGVNRNYRLGYKNSQALVSMIRTPNNTLPIYWWRKKPNGDKWNGIFTR